jgi:hypothetical protein
MRRLFFVLPALAIAFVGSPFASGLPVSGQTTAGARIVSGGTPAAASGTVLASDDCSDANSGILPRSSQNSNWITGCVNGAYQMTSINPIATIAGQRHYVFTTGSYTDVSVAVDVSLAADSDSPTTVGPGCRYSGTGNALTGYRIYYFPASNQWNLVRDEAGNSITLTGRNAAFPLNGPSLGTAHLQLTCSGDTISVNINGTQLFTTQDSTYQQGRVALVVGMGTKVDDQDQIVAGYTGKADARFTNLVLTQP